MDSTKLDRSITFQRYALTLDEKNQPTEAWTDLFTARASWRRASANERLAGGQIGAQVTDVFQTRWYSELAYLDPKDRLIFGGRAYDIAEVTEIGLRDGLRIAGSARVDVTVAQPSDVPMLDFSVAANSMYVPLLFEDF